jgi:hypothetical protein
LDQRRAEISGFDRGDALAASRDFVSRIGNVFPIALCGRTDPVREKWQPVGESNPSFQVENLAS